jgi:hypothetical protein
MSGRMTVDIVGEKLSVRPIIKERGMFKAGAPLMEFAATKLLAGEGY